MKLFTDLSAIAFSLFILMDPIGNIPLFLSILKDFDAKRQRWIVFREMFFALAVILIFYFIGDKLLKLLGVSQNSLLVSGGIILFLIALRMIFPSSQEEHPKALKDPFIVPLAIPFVAGPAVLATVMLYSLYEGYTGIVFSAIILAWIPSTLILLGASFLKKYLGQRGIIACERLMGLLLTLIAIEMFLEGLHAYFHPALNS